MNNIPEGWKEDSLKVLLSKIIDYRGQSVPKAKIGIPLITARNIKKGYINFFEQEYIDEKKFEKWMSRGIPQNGDLIFTTEAPLGNIAYYPRTGIHGIGQRTLTIRVNKKLITSGFLFYFLLSDWGQYLIDRRSSGSTAKGIKSSEFKKIKITYSRNLDEQQRIVTVLEAWDKMLELLDKKIEIKNSIKKGLVQQLLSSELRLPGFSEYWRDMKLGEVGEFSKGKGILKKEVDKIGYNAVRYGELYTKHNTKILNIYSYISKQVAKDSISIQKGGIVFAGSGETIEEIGKSAVYLNDEVCYVGGDTLILSQINQNSLYLAYLLNSQIIRRELRKLGQGQSVVHIYKKDLSEMQLSLPPLPEQNAIASILTSADKEIEILEKKREVIADQKKYFLNNLITGQIRVPKDIKLYK